MKKYIKSSVVELKDGTTENISFGDSEDFRWLVEDRLGYECASYFDEITDGYDEIIKSLIDIIKMDCIPYMDKENASKIEELLNNENTVYSWF